jgi:methionine sulfoxide reductase catalytic subunit
MDEILKLAPLEERIYRHRCVEGWSIVVPWIGYSFDTLAKVVEPNPNVKFVAFESYFDKKTDAVVGACWDSSGPARR